MPPNGNKMGKVIHKLGNRYMQEQPQRKEEKEKGNK
jgi:hypothetical protein